jgi:hypothetical protein
VSLSRAHPPNNTINRLLLGTALLRHLNTLHLPRAFGGTFEISSAARSSSKMSTKAAMSAENIKWSFKKQQITTKTNKKS